jgi:pyruvate/2-oxoglutarate dehydrogenase complex dihydrolipoamide acyltransferase (E2) component
MARRLHQKVDLAVAVDTGDGLFAPVLRNVQVRDRPICGAALKR